MTRKTFGTSPRDGNPTDINVELTRALGKPPDWLLPFNAKEYSSPKQQASNAWSFARDILDDLADQLDDIQNDEDLSARGKQKRATETIEALRSSKIKSIDGKIAKLKDKVAEYRQPAELSEMQQLVREVRRSQLWRYIPSDPFAVKNELEYALDRGDLETASAILELPDIHPGKLQHHYDVRPYYDRIAEAQLDAADLAELRTAEEALQVVENLAADLDAALADAETDATRRFSERADPDDPMADFIVGEQQ